MSAIPASTSSLPASPSSPTSPFGMRTPAANRYAAAMVLLVIVVAAIAAVAGPAWWAYDRYDSSAAQLARELRSYTSLNLLRPTLMKSVEALKARDTKKYFLKGSTAALAGAELQDVVRVVIEANNGKLLSSQLLAHKDDNGYRQVNATITMMANIQNLRQVLYAIETREPYLFLDNLTIRSQVPSNFKPQPGVEPEMFIQFDVAGLTPTTIAAPAADATPPTPNAKASSKAKP